MLSAYDFQVFPAPRRLRTMFGTFSIVDEPSSFVRTWPVASQLTTPLPFTLAIAVLLACQVPTRPVNGLPFASLGVAVSCNVLPTATLPDAGVTVTEATGTGVTVMDAVPLWPSLVAVIVAEPATFAVTSPVPFPVATVVLLVDLANVPPGRLLPL